MNIKCPFCEGVANKLWFSHLETTPTNIIYAVFVVECWSGDLNKLSKHHYFQARVKLLKTVEVDQVRELEQEIDSLRTEIDEAEG